MIRSIRIHPPGGFFILVYGLTCLYAWLKIPIPG